MTEFLILLISTALVNNVVLVKFLGLCPFLGVSKKVDAAIGMGLATTFVLTLASAASWMLEHWLLAPLGLGYLRIVSFIMVIAAAVQFVELAIKKFSPDLYQVLDTSDLPGGVVNIVTGAHGELAKPLASHLDLDAVWSFSSTDLSALVEREAAGNLKRSWVNNAKATDWAQAEGRAFLRAATEVKTIWVPYGE